MSYEQFKMIGLMIIQYSRQKRVSLLLFMLRPMWQKSYLVPERDKLSNESCLLLVDYSSIILLTHLSTRIGIFLLVHLHSDKGQWWIIFTIPNVIHSDVEYALPQVVLHHYIYRNLWPTLDYSLQMLF